MHDQKNNSDFFLEPLLVALVLAKLHLRNRGKPLEPRTPYNHNIKQIVIKKKRDLVKRVRRDLGEEEVEFDFNLWQDATSYEPAGGPPAQHLVHICREGRGEGGRGEGGGGGGETSKRRKRKIGV